jgi:phospholipid-binding lipoprotein MlaA
VKFLRSSWAAIRGGGAALLLVGLALGGCATPPSDPAARAEFEKSNDPLEPLNRKTFAFNLFLDHAILRPAAKVYVAVLPDDARKAIHHVLDNMKEPTLFFDNVLQGEFKRAGITLGRFVVNSTIGVGGMVDVMALSGVERQTADFGQTLFVWGVPSGPYLILPILGPSNPRDAIGGAVDSYADPFTILAKNDSTTDLLTYRFIVAGIEDRADVLDVLDDLEKNSVDFYAQLRSLTQQHRDAELRHGVAPEAAPDLYKDPGLSKAPGLSKEPGQPVPPAAKPGATKIPAARAVAAAKTQRLAHGGWRRQPARNPAMRCSSNLTRASAPPLCRTPANSERRVASSLIVPLR